MSSTDKPALHQGSLSATKIYTGSDAPDTSGDTASPPNGSLYVRRDPTGAAPQGEVGVFEYAPSYTPSGLSAVPAGWRPLVGGEVINVKRFGATGDGTTDDYPAIASAIDAARKATQYGTGAKGAILFFPPGIYKVSQPLNCTASQYNLVGSGPYQTVLRGATGAGKPVIDLTGSGYSTVRDLLIDVVTDGEGNHTTASSTVGILIARLSTADSTSGVNLDNVIVRLESSTSANNGKGTVAVYNFGGEEANYHNVFLRGDCGLMITSSNATGSGGYGLTSSYQTILTADTSMTALSITGLSSLLGIAGPALRLNGGGAVQCDAYLGTFGGTYEFPSVTPYPFAIHSTSMWVDFRYSGDMEGFAGLLHLDGQPMYGARLYAYMGRSTAQPAIKLSGTAQLVESDVDITATSTSLSTVNYLIDDDYDPTSNPSAPQKFVTSCHIKLRNQKIRLRSGGSIIQGNVIQSSDTLATTLTRISAPNLVSGNVITASDSVEVNGVTVQKSTGWGVPLGTATRSAFTTSTVTTAQLAERVKALIDDLTARNLLGV